MVVFSVWWMLLSAREFTSLGAPLHTLCMQVIGIGPSVLASQPYVVSIR